MDPITDHGAEAIDRLPQFLKDKPNLAAWLEVLCGPIQRIEDALIQLLTERAVDTAIGDQLDDLGTIVGQRRDGLADDDFRRYIRARIAANRACGLTDELLRIVRLIVDDSGATIRLTPSYPAAVVIRVSMIPVDVELASTLVSFLRDAASAGVRLVLEWSELPEADLFYWDSTSWDDGLGWSVQTE